MIVEGVLSELAPGSYLNPGWSPGAKAGVALLAAGVCAGSGAAATNFDLETSLWCGGIGLALGAALAIYNGPGKVQQVGPFSLHTRGELPEQSISIHCLVCAAREVPAGVCVVRRQLRLCLVLPLWWRRYLIVTCRDCHAEHVAAVRPELLASYSADTLAPRLTRSPHVF